MEYFGAFLDIWLLFAIGVGSWTVGTWIGQAVGKRMYGDSSDE